MGRARDRVALVEVVGADPHPEQAVHQPPHGFDLVVDAGEQHGLRAQRDAAVGEQGAGAVGFRGAFVRVGEVQAHHQRMVAAQHAHQRGRDPLGQHRRHLGADADDLHVGDHSQPGEHPVELVVREQQRVAAGQEHVADGRPGGDVGERLFQPLPGRAQGIVAHQTRAGAVTAVGRAAVGKQQQHPVGVAVDQARHRAHGALVERVVGFAGRTQGLAHRGHHRAAQRLGRVVRVEQAQVVGGDGQRQAAARTRCLFLVGKVEHGGQPVEAADPVGQLPVPVVPEPGGDVGEVFFSEALRGPGAESGLGRGQADHGRGRAGGAPAPGGAGVTGVGGLVVPLIEGRGRNDVQLVGRHGAALHGGSLRVGEAGRATPGARRPDSPATDEFSGANIGLLR